MNNQFRRRIYSGWGAFWSDLRLSLAYRKKARKSDPVSLAFRERLMLVVTEVNGCRYCSYFHAQVALTSGVPADELRDLLAGSIPVQTPAFELPALAYAQHWAERDARPDPDAEDRLRAIYGADGADAIHSVLRMIRIGNLLGNTGDYWLYWLSFGRLGIRADERRFAVAEPIPARAQPGG